MTLIIVLLSLVVYANIGVAVGCKTYNVLKEADPNDLCGAQVSGVIMGVLWPLIAVLLLCTLSIHLPAYLKDRRDEKAKALKAASTNALPPAESNSAQESSPVREARELCRLEEKLRLLKLQSDELSEEINKKKADPEVAKVLKLPHRF